MTSSIVPAVRGLADRAGDIIVAGVDKGVETRWIPAKERAARAVGTTHKAKLLDVRKAFASELGLIGAAAGGAAALPGVGTAASLTLAAADLGWTTMRLADLVLTVAALHGHEEADIDERRMWVLAVLAGGSTSTKVATKLAKEVGKGLGGKATRAIPAATLSSINKVLGRTIITKYGTKRGAIAIGRLLPFGIGAAIGGSLNFATVRAVTRGADKFFSLLSGDASEAGRPE